MTSPAYTSSSRRDPDNISLISATVSLAPSYRTTFNDTQLVPPSFRPYGTSETPRTRSYSAGASSQAMNLNVYSIPGFQNFNLPRNEETLHKIASRRQTERMERTLKQFSINYEREQFAIGSSSSHPMLAQPRKLKSKSFSLPQVEEEYRCPLELDNEVWDYGFMCNGSYPSLQYYQRRAREITRYEEKEEAIRMAHKRHCIQRSGSDASQNSVSSITSSSRE